MFWINEQTNTLDKYQGGFITEYAILVMLILIMILEMKF